MEKKNIFFCTKVYKYNDSNTNIWIPVGFLKQFQLHQFQWDPMGGA